MRGSKTGRHILIQKRPGRPDGRRGSPSRGAMEIALGCQHVVALGEKACREHQNIPDGGHRKHRLEGHGIGALVEDNDVAVTGKEGPRRCKIAGLEVGKWIVEELVRAG